MALIRCPECQREISDKSNQCIHCGCPIEKSENESKKQSLNKTTNESSFNTTKKNQNDTSVEFERILSVTQIPKKKPIINFILILSIVCFILGIVFFMLIYFAPNNHGIDFTVIVITGVLLITGLLLFFNGFNSLKNDRKLYEIYHDNSEEYKKQIALKIYNNIRSDEQYKERKIQQKEKNNSLKIKCPNCGSTNTQRISISSRAISIGTVGILSNKINKSFKCNKCKYTW